MNKTKKTKLLHFEEMSAVLTGFSLADIQGTGMSEAYLVFLEERKPPVPIDGLLSAFDNLHLDPANLSTEDLSMISLVLEDKAIGPLSRQIIFMWYTGQWNYGKEDTFVISEKAYIESFSYVASGAHPAGAKQPGFGTWQFPPLTFPDI